MKITALLLMMIGMTALAYGAVGYHRHTMLFGEGGLRITTTENKSHPAAPVAGAIVLLGGVALLVLPRRRLAWPA